MAVLKSLRAMEAATCCVMIEGGGRARRARSQNTPLTATEFSGTIGLPLPSIDVSINDTIPFAARGASGRAASRSNVTPGDYHSLKRMRRHHAGLLPAHGDSS